MALFDANRLNLLTSSPRKLKHHHLHRRRHRPRSTQLKVEMTSPRASISTATAAVLAGQNRLTRSGDNFSNFMMVLAVMAEATVRTATVPP